MRPLCVSIKILRTHHLPLAPSTRYPTYHGVEATRHGIEVDMRVWEELYSKSQKVGILASPNPKGLRRRKTSLICPCPCSDFLDPTVGLRV